MKHSFKLMILAILLAVQGAYALDLAGAKAQGWVGEQRDGYLGLVKSDAPDEVRNLVDEVNRQRRAQFEQIAAKNGIPADEAAKVFAREAAQRTQPGNYLQGPGGWIRK